MTSDEPGDAPFAGDVQPLPQELVTEMLADEGIRDLLAHIYRDAGLDAQFEAIPRQMHETILARLVADGHIRLAEPDA